MLGSYFKIAFKVLLRRKFYTAVSLFGIAFTLLVLIVATAIGDEIWRPGYPEEATDRTLGIYGAKASGDKISMTSSPGYALLDRFARDLPGVERMSIVSNATSVATYVEGDKVELQLRRTDAAFWEIMSFEFLEGGPLSPADDELGNFVAVINERTRDRVFHGEPAVGRELRADGQAFTIVGVVRDVAPTRMLSFAEVWVPLKTTKSTTYRERLIGGFTGILLAESRAWFPEIKAEFRRRLADADLSTTPRFDTIESAARTMLEEMASREFGGAEADRAKIAWLFVQAFLMAVLFMALPAINLVNLNLSRILERSSEIGVRKAFGASSRALVGQFLLESVVLTLLGGIVGLAGAEVVLAIINEIEIIPYASVHVNYRVFGYGLVLSVAFGVLSGGYPAWRMSRLHPVDALRGRS